MSADEAGPGSLPAQEILNEVYGELRRLAATKMAREAPGHTLQATALVHEAWLRMESQRQDAFADRTGYFKAAAETMRRILIDRARAKKTAKRGGGAVSMDDAEMESTNLDYSSL